jgi:hypothetical protein
VLIWLQSAEFSVNGAAHRSPLSSCISTLPDRKSIDKVSSFQFKGAELGAGIGEVLAVDV